MSDIAEKLKLLPHTFIKGNGAVIIVKFNGQDNYSAIGPFFHKSELIHNIEYLNKCYTKNSYTWFVETLVEPIKT